jgi:hypothetical protein
MPNSRLANSNRTDSADYLALWQMPVAYNQPLAILITPILEIEDTSLLSQQFKRR